MSDFPPQLPHGEFREIFSDVFFLKGQIRIEADPVSEFSRNMVVIRDHRSLTLVNTIRLDEAGLAALDALGTVSNIVKLGAFHGRDDAFYVDRYGADLWAQAGMTYTRGEKTDHELANGLTGPNPDSTAFVFDTPKLPESILHLKRHRGVIITCDSFQNMLGPDEYFNAAAAEAKARLGFFKKAVIGPGWRKFAEPKTEDIEQVLKLEFQHLLSAHGEPLLDNAYAAVSDTISEFPAKS
ncbi:MAG: hypothetical protein COA78_15065 [Blastopirellula sp.]|nr:MAG: hypothetical protein COA78_15065 [Blastopirellula sp.]